MYRREDEISQTISALEMAGPARCYLVGFVMLWASLRRSKRRKLRTIRSRYRLENFPEIFDNEVVVDFGKTAMHSTVLADVPEPTLNDTMLKKFAVDLIHFNGANRPRPASDTAGR